MKRHTYQWICFFCIVVSTAHAQNNVPTHPVDGQFITEWLVIGPFPRNLDLDFLGEFGGEAQISPVEPMSAQEMMEAIFADLREFSGDARQSDDMTVVVVKVTELIDGIVQQLQARFV